MGTTVTKTGIFDDVSRGASVTEVLLSMAIVAMAAPFVYTQIVRTNNDIVDMRVARDVTSVRDDVMNFVRMNQDKWPDTAQIKLSDEELKSISEFPHAGFIDKYDLHGAMVTDVYLAFDLSLGALRAADIARDIGGDAAVVGADGIAYGDTWAVSAPDFQEGNLIYRISRDFSGTDTQRFLHRGTSGEDDLNTMFRDLNMGGFNIFDIGGISAKSFKLSDASAAFLTSPDVATQSAFFSGGAIIDGGTVSLGAVRVTGDMTGFRNISAARLNGTSYTTSGHIITDRATVVGDINVARDLRLKASSLRTISGFTAISANTVAAPYISAQEIIFYDNFGLTLSGELLMSTTAPLKIGSWTFPSNTPPKFSSLTISRAAVPAAPRRAEFVAITGAGWKSVMPKNEK